MSGPPVEIEVARSGGALFAARVSEGQVTDLWAERDGDTLTEGAVVCGRIGKRLPGGKGAWVDIGLGRSAPMEASSGHGEGTLVPVQLLASRRAAREGKAPAVSPDIALPGRFLIHRPLGSGLSFSRRLKGEARAPWPSVLGGQPGGWLVRSAAAFAPASAPPGAVEAEAGFLARAGTGLAERAATARPGGGLIPPPAVWQRLLCDLPDPVAIRADTPDLHAQISKWLRQAAPDLEDRLVSAPASALLSLLDDPEVLVSPSVALDGGGTLWIEPTRALTAVDIDAPRGAAPTEANIQAARLLARLIRLRNLGGLFAVDFLRMGRPADRAAVLAALRDGLEESPAQHQFARQISPIGPYLFSRQRRGSPVADVMEEGAA